MTWDMGALCVPPTPLHPVLAVLCPRNTMHPRLTPLLGWDMLPFLPQHRTQEMPHPGLLPLAGITLRGPMNPFPAPCPPGCSLPLWGSKGREQPHPTAWQAAGTRALRSCGDFGAQADARAEGTLGGWHPPGGTERSVSAHGAVHGLLGRPVSALTCSGPLEAMAGGQGLGPYLLDLGIGPAWLAPRLRGDPPPPQAHSWHGALGAGGRRERRAGLPASWWVGANRAGSW